MQVSFYRYTSGQSRKMSGINIPLEGRTRLPGKIQDAIQDCGIIVAHLQTASRSNEVCHCLALRG